MSIISHFQSIVNYLILIWDELFGLIPIDN